MQKQSRIVIATQKEQNQPIIKVMACVPLIQIDDADVRVRSSLIVGRTKQKHFDAKTEYTFISDELRRLH